MQVSNDIILIRGSRHVVWECGDCGVIATCPERVYEHHRAEGGFRSCPNGHRWGWDGKTCEREQLRRERDLLKQQIARTEDERREAMAEAVARADKAERAERKMRRRIQGGVCPCCNRTFLNMQRHMKTKHPNVVPLEQKQA